MHQDPSPDDAQRTTPDRTNPADQRRLSEIRRLLRLHGFHVGEEDVWGDPRRPVVVRVECCEACLKDYALIREAVASGVPDPHTLISLYAADLRDRCCCRQQDRRWGVG